MNLEILKPELMQRVNAHIQTGQFHDTDELIEKALDALDERQDAAPEDGSLARRGRDIRLAPDQPTTKLTVFEQGLGMFGSRKDATLLDEVVALAYAERRRPSKDQPFAL
jgi:Arc/MetJ-type ribon-helix-helix transcriptional regulator